MAARIHRLAPTARAVLLAVLAVGLFLHAPAARAWECTMSGARACPCACAGEAAPRPTQPEVQRRACCKPARAAVASPAVLERSTAAVPHLEPLVPSTVVVGPGCDDRAPPARRVRGPPRVAAFLRNARLLL